MLSVSLFENIARSTTVFFKLTRSFMRRVIFLKHLWFFTSKVGALDHGEIALDLMSLYVHVGDNFSATFLSINTLSHDLGKLLNEDWVRIDLLKAWLAAIGTAYGIVTGYQIANVFFYASFAKALATFAALFRLDHHRFTKDTVKQCIVRPTRLSRSYLNLASHQCSFF